MFKSHIFSARRSKILEVEEDENIINNSVNYGAKQPIIWTKSKTSRKTHANPSIQDLSKANKSYFTLRDEQEDSSSSSEDEEEKSEQDYNHKFRLGLAQRILNKIQAKDLKELKADACCVEEFTRDGEDDEANQDNSREDFKSETEGDPYDNWRRLKKSTIQLIRVTRLLKGARENNPFAFNKRIQYLSEEDNEESPKWRISSENPRLKLFVYFVSIYSILDIFINTYYLFTKTNSFYYNMIGLPLYLLQIVLNFFTIDKKTSQVFGIKYLTWKTLHLIIDIITFLPFFLISHGFLVLKLVRIVKFTTLIENLLKMVTAFIEYFGFSKKDGLIQASKNFIQFTLYLFYAAHFFSCFWIWIGKESENSWISASQELIEDTESNFDLYISSFYLVITIFASVGYGDFNWGLDHELIYLFIVKL